MHHHNIIMRETRRKYRSHILQEAKRPLSGAYWWYPVPDTKKTGTAQINSGSAAWKWDIIEFYDEAYRGNTLHTARWRDVLQAIAIAWNRDYDVLRRTIGNHYTGLPRGRVNAVPMSTPDGYQNGMLIAHGNDAPYPEAAALSMLLNVFNLRALWDRGLVRMVYDDHERMLPDDYDAVSSLFAFDMGLRSHVDNATDEYDYYDDADDDDNYLDDILRRPA